MASVRLVKDENTHTNIMAKATLRQTAKFSNKLANAVLRREENEKDQEPFFFSNGCLWRRGFTTLNKLLLWENSLSFNESTGYRLIFNMFAHTHSFWIDQFV